MFFLQMYEFFKASSHLVTNLAKVNAERILRKTKSVEGIYTRRCGKSGHFILNNKPHRT